MKTATAIILLSAVVMTMSHSLQPNLKQYPDPYINNLFPDPYNNRFPDPYNNLFPDPYNNRFPDPYNSRFPDLYINNNRFPDPYNSRFPDLYPYPYLGSSKSEK